MSAFTEKIAIKRRARRTGAVHTAERADAIGRSLRSRQTRGELSLWKVEGGIHKHPAVALRDTERKAWLAARGYRVIEIDDDPARSDPHAAAERIMRILRGDTPTPNPSPQGGGGL